MTLSSSARQSEESQAVQRRFRRAPSPGSARVPGVVFRTPWQRYLDRIRRLVRAG